MTLHPSETIKAYCKWVDDRISDGFEPTLITIMFEELGGSDGTKMNIMRRSVEAFYAHSLTRIFRHPRHRHTINLPLWLVCLDFPVHKNDRDHLADIAINNGMHMHGVSLVPPDNRLTMSFADHIKVEQSRYTDKSSICRIHAVDITRTPERATRYVFKAVTRRLVETDTIFILPRSHSEMH